MTLRRCLGLSVPATLATCVGLAVASATLAAPGEVVNLAWCSGTKTCLQWDAAPGALQYHVYRGERLSLPCLLNPAFDSCNDGTVVTNSTGTTVTEVPAAGGFFWFLVTADDGGGEGTYGLATAGPRDSEHNGACTLSCVAAGAVCSVSGDCCSGSCVAGICQTACCEGTGAVCLQNGDCCSGACSGGICHAPCSPPGGACLGGADCCGAANAQGSCTANTCGFSCNSGFANCDGSTANGCECTGNICCGGACEPPHVNGLGQSFDDCSPLGVPGTAATYTHTLAAEARAAWPFFGTDSDATCGTNTAAVIRQTLTACAVWAYNKATAGYVHLNSADNTCICPTTSDPTWR